MIKHQRREKEQGQIIILLAVSIVVVMMVAALAVDGGMVYSERRFAQNAADASGFAGGGAVLNSGELDEVLICPVSSSYNDGSGNFSDANNVVAMAVIAAQSRGTANNVSSLPYLGYKVNDVVKEDFGLEENQGLFVECHDSDPVKSFDIFVRVTSQVSTAFAHLIYPGPLQTTNEAVVRLTQEVNAISGDAVISLGPGCDGGNGGIILAGNPEELTITESGAFSNSCLKIGSNLNKEITVEDGIKIHGEVDASNDKHYEIIADQIFMGYSKLSETFPDPPKPDCTGLTTYSAFSPSGNIIPKGHYPNGISIPNGTYQFEPGLYCVDNTFTFHGGEISGVDVTFYLSEGASVHYNGNTEIKLVAQRDTSSPYLGILFYIDGTGDVLWNGTGSSHYNGLIYAPKRLFEFKGNAYNTGASCPEITGYTDVCKGIEFPTQYIAYQITFQASSASQITNPKDGAKALHNNLFLKD